MDILELNTVARPKGNWYTPASVDEALALMNSGESVVEYFTDYNVWEPLNPLQPLMAATWHKLLAAGRIRIDPDRQYVIYRSFWHSYQIADKQFVSVSAAKTKEGCKAKEQHIEFLGWIDQRFNMTTVLKKVVF